MKLGIYILTKGGNECIIYIRNNMENEFLISVSGKEGGSDISLDNIAADDLSFLATIASSIIKQSGDKDQLPAIAVINKCAAIKIPINDYNLPIVREFRDISKTKSLGPENSKIVRKIADDAIKKYGSNEFKKFSIHPHIYDKNIKSEWSFDVDKDNHYTESKPILIKDSNYLYGSVTDAGGVNPNIHIKTIDDENITVSISKEQLSNMKGNILYKPIGMLVNYVVDVNTGEKSEYQFVERVPYRPTMPRDEIDNILNSYNGTFGVPEDFINLHEEEE